jgi:hypothetical protein
MAEFDEWLGVADAVKAVSNFDATPYFSSLDRRRSFSSLPSVWHDGQ